MKNANIVDDQQVSHVSQQQFFHPLTTPPLDQGIGCFLHCTYK